jgi:hypothetical protein
MTIFSTLGLILSTLNMEAALSFDTSVNIYQTIQRHIPEERNLHRSWNLILRNYISLMTSL